MIIKKLTLLLFIFVTASVFGQYQVTIEAFVMDKSTKQPLEFANIKFQGKSINAISGENGQFTLVYDEEAIGDADVFQCSAFGYETLTVKAGLLFKLLTNSNKIFLKPKAFILGKSEEMKGNISGTVVGPSGPIQGATIRIKNSFNEVQSNVDGAYKIDAQEDDVLVISYLGMIERQIMVTKDTTIKIEMESDGELLDEVLLEGEKKVEKIVETGLGKKNADAVGFSVNTITSDDISVGALTLADVIIGKFAGVRVMGLNTMTAPRFLIRGGGGSINNPIPAIFVVDGMIYTEMPEFLNLDQIDKITILKSVGSTNRFGTVGSGGAFLIKMKVGLPIVKKPVNKALIKGNEYLEELALIGDTQETPPYIVQLERAKSYEEALKLYSAQKRYNKQLRIPYYLDVSEYFTKWDKDFAYKILTGIAEVTYKNPKALKILAYKLEQIGKLEAAKQMYQRIAVLRPKHAQSYRDLALIYEANGNYEEAMDLYGKMLNKSIEGVDFSGLDKAINNELKHMLAVHREKIDCSRIDAEFLKADFKYDLRIVFDYNDPNTEFDLQFVNPKKKFFRWSHTKFDNRKRLLDEIKNGYHSEEFVIDDAKAGEWIINIECLSEEPPMNPTYLKYTVYKNYGLPTETKEIKLVKLYQQQQKVTLDRFLYQ